MITHKFSTYGAAKGTTEHLNRFGFACQLTGLVLKTNAPIGRVKKAAEIEEWKAKV